MTNRHPLLSVATLASQIVNNFIPGKYRHHNLTVSARCYIQRADPGWRRAYAIINGMFFWETNHCRESFELDVEFAEQIKQIASRWTA